MPAAGLFEARRLVVRELVRRSAPRLQQSPSSKRSPRPKGPREIQQLPIGASTAPVYSGRRLEIDCAVPALRSKSRDPTPRTCGTYRLGSRYRRRTRVWFMSANSYIDVQRMEFTPIRTDSRTKSRSADPDDCRSARFSHYANWQSRQPMPVQGRSRVSIGCS
jgi:hypothetical protein